MKKPRRSKSWMVTGLGVVSVVAAIYASSLTFVAAADPPVAKVSDAKPTEATAADAKAPPTKPAKKKLTGAELYSIHCNRCHAERYATEFTSAQWKTVMLHMRVRANLPAAQAREILKYLQEDSGN